MFLLNWKVCRILAPKSCMRQEHVGANHYKRALQYVSVMAVITSSQSNPMLACRADRVEATASSVPSTSRMSCSSAATRLL